MQEKGFFASLFDIGFRSFVTTKIVSVLFVISIVLSALYTLFILVAGFSNDSGVGVLFLVLSPIIFFLLVLYSRILLEFVVVVFRIYENTSVMIGAVPPPGAVGGPPQAPPPPPPSENPTQPLGGPSSPQGPQSPGV